MVEQELQPILWPQSKKRGLSLEEKRKCVLEIFHDTKEVFQLKVGMIPRGA